MADRYDDTHGPTCLVCSEEFTDEQGWQKRHCAYCGKSGRIHIHGCTFEIWNSRHKWACSPECAEAGMLREDLSWQPMRTWKTWADAFTERVRKARGKGDA